MVSHTLTSAVGVVCDGAAVALGLTVVHKHELAFSLFLLSKLFAYSAAVYWRIRLRHADETAGDSTICTSLRLLTATSIVMAPVAGATLYFGSEGGVNVSRFWTVVDAWTALTCVEMTVNYVIYVTCCVWHERVPILAAIWRALAAIVGH